LLAEAGSSGKYEGVGGYIDLLMLGCENTRCVGRFTDPGFKDDFEFKSPGNAYYYYHDELYGVWVLTKVDGKSVTATVYTIDYSEVD